MCDGTWKYPIKFGGTLKIDKPWIIICSNAPPSEVYTKKHHLIEARFNVVNVDEPKSPEFPPILRPPKSQAAPERINPFKKEPEPHPFVCFNVPDRQGHIDFISAKLKWKSDKEIQTAPTVIDELEKPPPF